VRDRLSQKAKYAFIAFKDPHDYLRAWKEMDGELKWNGISLALSASY
jgi:hypothetical protein